MLKILAPLAACAALTGCVGYGYGYDAYGYGYPAYPSYPAYQTYPGYGYSNYGYPGGAYYPGSVTIYRDSHRVYDHRPHRAQPAHRGGGRGDRDRDGIPNRVDRDRDGDGVPNRRDARPDNPRRR